MFKERQLLLFLVSIRFILSVFLKELGVVAGIHMRLLYEYHIFDLYHFIFICIKTGYLTSFITLQS